MGLLRPSILQLWPQSHRRRKEEAAEWNVGREPLWREGAARKRCSGEAGTWSTQTPNLMDSFTRTGQLEVVYNDGGTETYTLFLGISADATAEALLQTEPASVLAHVRSPQGDGLLQRGAEYIGCRCLAPEPAGRNSAM